MGDAELTVAGVRMVEMPFLALVDGLVAAAAGGFPSIDEGCNGSSPALVLVTPAAAGGRAGWLVSAVGGHAPELDAGGRDWSEPTTVASLEVGGSPRCLAIPHGVPSSDTTREVRMYAVVARATITDFEQARKYLREEGIPRLSRIPGFISGHWVRLGEKAGASMILFESEEAAQAGKQRMETCSSPVVTPISIEVGEVQEHT